MIKKISGLIKLQINANRANPSPPIGPALGQRGLNIMEFCKKFNDKTKNLDPNLKVQVQITVYSDKTFDFSVRQPSVSILLKKAAGIKSGSKMPGKEAPVAKISESKIRDIVQIKLSEMTAYNAKTAIEMVKGTARSMGIKVID